MSSKKSYLTLGIWLGLGLAALLYRIPFNNAISQIQFYVLKLRNTIDNSIGALKQFLSYQSALIEENNFLRSEYQKLYSQLYAYTHCFTEAQKKSASLEAYIYDQAALRARILLRRCSEKEQIFFIDKGSLDGIKNDMVVVFGSLLMGKVKDVSPYYSQVSFVHDAKSNVPVIFEKSKTVGIVQGTGSSKHGVVIFAQGASLPFQKEKIFSSGDGLVYPEGFFVGTVSSVLDEGAIYPKIIVDMAFDSTDNTIQYCYVLTNKDPEVHSQMLSTLTHMWEVCKNDFLSPLPSLSPEIHILQNGLKKDLSSKEVLLQKENVASQKKNSSEKLLKENIIVVNQNKIADEKNLESREQSPLTMDTGASLDSQDQLSERSRLTRRRRRKRKYIDVNSQENLSEQSLQCDENSVDQSID